MTIFSFQFFEFPILYFFWAMNFKFLNILDLSAILERFWIRDKNIIKTNPIQCTSLLYAESISAINLISKNCKDIDLRKLECVGINMCFF